MGLVIDISYDSSVDNAPAAFKAAVADAVAFFESWFTNPITIHIDVGYGEVGGQALGAGDLGESLTSLDNFSYAQIKKRAGSGRDVCRPETAVGTLPSADPADGNYWVATAEAKALGLLGASSSVDGYVGFSSTAPFAYDPNNRAVPQIRLHRRRRARDFRGVGQVFARCRDDRQYVEQLRAIGSLPLFVAGCPRFRRHAGRVFLDQRRQHEPRQLQHQPERRLWRLGRHRRE